MTTFRTKAVYKSKAPEDTIAQVKDILSSCDINVSEKYLHQTAPDTHAAELYLNEPGINNMRIASNGKGMTKSYALASAYGEFMERLQCGSLLYVYREEAFRIGDVNFKWAPDETEISSDECIEKYGDALKAFFGFTDDRYHAFCEKLKNKKLMCLPFRDVQEDKTVLLPYDNIHLFSSSNGMCAGNDAKEAQAQGISELYERDALMRIYRDNQQIPIMRKELFEDTEIIKHLRCLEEKGYSTDILDCSMGLDYPVIGLRVIGDEGLYLSLGGDPNPVVALERCLTEMFQLTDESKVRKRASAESCGTRKGCRNLIEESYYHYQLLRSKRMGSGEKPDNIHNLAGKYSEEYVWDTQDNSYDYLVQLTKKLGYHLYVRDCSYLGFPAYITFIPEISLGDYADESDASDIGAAFTGEFDLKEPEHYNEILPILKRLEKKQIDAYKRLC